MPSPTPPPPNPLPIIHINGLPGTGKLTIAREALALLQHHFTASGSTNQVKLVHNHLLINPADAVLHRTQPGYQALRKALRDAVFSTLSREPATFATVYLFTDWQSGDAAGSAVCREYQAMARERGSGFVPVLVSCGEAENITRLGSGEREGWGKITDKELLVRFRGRVDAPPVYLFEGVEERLEVDVTGLSAGEAARVVVGHVLRWFPMGGE